MRRGSNLLAAAWGFAEATLLFIVPDVLLTGLALSSLKRALLACLAAAAGATLGGLAVYLAVSAYPDRAVALLMSVPGISDTTFITVKELLEPGQFQGMLVGAFTGVPYKIFAAKAARDGFPLAPFLLLTPLARLPRFAMLSLLAWSLSRALGDRLQGKWKLALCLFLWAAFYAVYFHFAGW